MVCRAGAYAARSRENGSFEGGFGSSHLARGADRVIASRLGPKLIAPNSNARRAGSVLAETMIV